MHPIVGITRLPSIASDYQTDPLNYYRPRPQVRRQRQGQAREYSDIASARSSSTEAGRRSTAIFCAFPDAPGAAARRRASGSCLHIWPLSVNLTVTRRHRECKLVEGTPRGLHSMSEVISAEPPQTMSRTISVGTTRIDQRWQSKARFGVRRSVELRTWAMR